MAHIESEFVRHTACPNCGSSDANSEYSDGHTYCYVCHARTPGNGENTHTHQMSTNVQLKGSAVRLQRRGLSEQTCQKYKIFRDGELLRHYYHTSDGILQGAKVKTKQKDFYYEGITTDTLFGQHLFPSSGKRIVVTEGVPVSDANTPVYSGSTVKLGFLQKPYLLRDGISYGTSLKLSGVQIITVQGGAGIDTGD